MWGEGISVSFIQMFIIRGVSGHMLTNYTEVQIRCQDWGGHKRDFFFFAFMQLIPCHHKSQLRRGSPYHSKSTCILLTIFQYGTGALVSK